MKQIFDEVIDREKTKSMKYARDHFEVGEDVIPLWVADMDFQTPVEVREALTDVATHGIFGYSGPDEEYNKAVLDWMKDHFGLQAEEEDMIQTPGVVFAIAQAVRAFTEPDDTILIQEPVYYPFRNVIEANGRKAVSSTLVEENGEYSIDFEDFEEKIVNNNVKLFILSNPHNPVGRVYTRDELEKMAKICLDHDATIVSDEIHADFVFTPNKHVTMPSLGDEVAKATILCTAPSKTFNLAGLQVSNIFIFDEKKREKYKKKLSQIGVGGISLPAYAACQAAYTYGADWVKSLNDYLLENMKYVVDFLEENIPEIKTYIPEGTYLMWLDCRDLGLEGEELNKFFLEKAKLWLDAGTMFGEGGEGFMRINVALPRERLKQALINLKNACDDLKN